MQISVLMLELHFLEEWANGVISKHSHGTYSNSDYSSCIIINCLLMPQNKIVWVSPRGRLGTTQKKLSAQKGLHGCVALDG